MRKRIAWCWAKLIWGRKAGVYEDTRGYKTVFARRSSRDAKARAKASARALGHDDPVGPMWMNVAPWGMGATWRKAFADARRTSRCSAPKS